MMGNGEVGREVNMEGSDGKLKRILNGRWKVEGWKDGNGGLELFFL